VAPHVLGATWTEPTSAAFHGLQAKQNLASCQTCHGTPGTILFDGGAASTRCSTCHTAAKAHPTTWYRAPVATFPGYVPSHRNSSNQSTACSICHDYTQGRTAPDSSAPSCFSASYTNAEHASVGCHSGGPGAPNHAVPFLDPVHLGVKQADFDGDCSNCHAVSGTSPVSSAPACQVCHTAGSPLSPTGSFGVCTSCHGNPPDGGTGASYPNIAGAHAAHLALNLAGTPVDCDTCHGGLGFVTQAHYDRANGRTGAGGRVPPGDLAFVATYNAKTGASSFSATAFTCTNVSCHGGQANLNWRTGTLDINTQCTSCHASGTAQYNSYNSGQHNRSQHSSRACTVCHNTTTLAVNHFTALGTTTMEGPASATIGGGTTEIPSGGYNAVTRSCNPTCHGSQTW
jgi:predicted CxxxxCH...CXXCH cytochrome family protein